MSGRLKMYILVKKLSPGYAALACAHASLACYRKFEDRPEMQEWISGLFRKVVCMVSDDQFEEAKRFGDHVVITESSLDHVEVALVFMPREEWPKFFQYLSLYR